MALVHDIMNMQKCGGVIITQDNEHVEVDRVAGILSQEIHQYVQLDSLGKFKIIPLETIKEARPLSLDYELPYPRGNDEDYYDKDGEDDSFELLGNEEPKEEYVKDEENIEPIDEAKDTSAEEPIAKEEPISFSRREDYTSSFDVYDEVKTTQSFGVIELNRFNNYKVLDSCYKCGYEVMLTTYTKEEAKYKIVYMCEHADTHFIVLDNHIAKSHVLLPEVKTVYPCLIEKPNNVPAAYLKRSGYIELASDLPSIIEPLEPLIKKTHYSSSDPSLNDLIREYLYSNKCFGLMVDEEVVFNTFENYTIKDKLEAEMLIRFNVSTNVSSFVNLIKDRNLTQHTNIFIYMVPSSPYMVKITYYPTSKIFIVNFFQSTKYKEDKEQITAEETYTEMIHEFHKNKGKNVSFMYKDELRTIEVSRATRKFVEGYCLTEKEYIVFDINYIYDLKTLTKEMNEDDIISSIRILTNDNRHPIDGKLIKKYLQDKNKEVNDFDKIMERLKDKKQIFENKGKYLTVPHRLDTLKHILNL
jgi:hypothetical protein